MAQDNCSSGTGTDQVRISNDVIAMIAGLAIADEDCFDKPMRRARGKDISVSVDGQEVTVSVDITINFGTKVPELAERIQKKIKNSVENMTGMTVKAVNVNVTGMNIEKSEINS